MTFPQYMEVFQDIRVRQAIAAALDVEAIAEAIYGKLGTVADSNVAPGVRYYTPIRTNEYNLEKAKRLLSDAGYNEGDLEFLMIYPNVPINEVLGPIVQDQLARVGIKVNIESGDFATIIPRLINDETELCLAVYGNGSLSASQFLDTISERTMLGAFRISDTEFNDFLRAGNASIDPVVRAGIYKDAQEWLAERYWNIPIASGSGAVLYHTNVDYLVSGGGGAEDVLLRHVKFN